MRPAEFLICAPATDRFMARDSDFTRFCSHCGERVMVAPSGVRVLAQSAELKILCSACFLLLERNTKNLEIRVARESLVELGSIVPNFWRERN